MGQQNSQRHQCEHNPSHSTASNLTQGTSIAPKTHMNDTSTRTMARNRRTLYFVLLDSFSVPSISFQVPLLDLFHLVLFSFPLEPGIFSQRAPSELPFFRLCKATRYPTPVPLAVASSSVLPLDYDLWQSFITQVLLPALISTEIRTRQLDNLLLHPLKALLLPLNRLGSQHRPRT